MRTERRSAMGPQRCAGGSDSALLRDLRLEPHCPGPGIRSACRWPSPAQNKRRRSRRLRFNFCFFQNAGRSQPPSAHRPNPAGSAERPRVGTAVRDGAPRGPPGIAAPEGPPCPRSPLPGASRPAPLPRPRPGSSPSLRPRSSRGRGARWPRRLRGRRSLPVSAPVQSRRDSLVYSFVFGRRSVPPVLPARCRAVLGSPPRQSERRSVAGRAAPRPRSVRPSRRPQGPLCVCVCVYMCVCAHLFPTLQTPLFRDAQRLCPERPFRTASGSRVRSQQRETGKPLHFVPERRAWSAVRNGRVSPRAVGRRSGSVPQVTLTSGLRLGARSSCADSEPLKGRSK